MLELTKEMKEQIEHIAKMTDRIKNKENRYHTCKDQLQEILDSLHSSTYYLALRYLCKRIKF